MLYLGGIEQYASALLLLTLPTVHITSSGLSHSEFWEMFAPDYGLWIFWVEGTKDEKDTEITQM